MVSGTLSRSKEVNVKYIYIQEVPLRGTDEKLIKLLRIQFKRRWRGERETMGSMMAQIYRRNLLFLLAAAPATFGLFSYSAYLLALPSPPLLLRFLHRPPFRPPISGNRERRKERRERSFSAKSTRQIGACKWSRLKDSANCNDGGDGRISREEILPLN